MIPRALDHHVFCLLTLVSGTFSVLFNGFFKLIIIINPPLGIQNNHILAYVVFWTVLQNDKKYNINRWFLFDLDIGSDFGQRKESKRGEKKHQQGPKEGGPIGLAHFAIQMRQHLMNICSKRVQVNYLMV